MKSWKITTDAVVAGISIALLASIATIAAAHAEALETATKANQAIEKAAPLVAAPSAAEVKKAKMEKYAAQREQLTPQELKELLALAGFEGKALKQAWAIVMRESTGRPTSHNGNSNTGDNSYGLFQINMIGSLGVDRREKFELKQNSELFNPLLNAQIAYFMSNGGADWGSWGLGPNAYNGGRAGSYYDWLAKYPD